MIEGQSGFLEPMNRRSRANAERVQKIIHALSDRFTGNPFPAQSSHFHPEDFHPGEIGGAVHPSDPILDMQPNGTYQEIALRGWDVT